MTTRRHDLVPLLSRLTLLQLVRFVVIAWIACAPRLTHATAANRAQVLTVVALLYLVVTALLETVRRRLRVRGLVMVSTLLLTDAVLVTAAITLTGGPAGPLMPLVYLCVVSTVLLLSYRSGLQLAVWYALLLCGSHALALAGYFGSTELAAAHSAGGLRAGIHAVAVLVVAAVVAMCSALNERRLRERGHELAGLVEFGHALDRVATAEEVLAQLVAHAQGRLRFARVAASLDREGRPAAVAPPDPPNEVSLPDVDHRTSAVGPMPDGREPRCLQRLDPGHALEPLLPNAHNVVTIELTADGVNLGTLAAEWGGHPPRIPVATVEALAQYVANASLAIRNATLLSEVQRLASHDALTGLANRRVFDDALARESDRHIRRGDPYAIVFIDVDHFKGINDRFGHATGDVVLRGVAQALSDGCRGADLAARYGGEEFAVLLPGCGGVDEALAAAERLRTAITARSRGAVTASAGVAVAPLHGREPAGLVAAADAALYRAKNAGRDRSEVALSEAVQAAGRNTERTQPSSLFLNSM
jgi:diguanylate cyclase (GGDEF)-like protein